MSAATFSTREPWNKGKLIGQKAPLKLKDIWAIRVRLQLMRRTRELALFDLGIDSTLRGCDLLKLRVRDICHGAHTMRRTKAAWIYRRTRNLRADSVPLELH